MSETALTTPLYDTHIAFGARMVEFAGWSMPLSFAGIIEEHLYTRSACSLFDVSHMGRIELSGSGCEAFLNSICTRNLSDAETGRCYYSHVCGEDGGVLDDVIVSRLESGWLVVCNASNREKILGWFRKHQTGYDVQLKDVTCDTAMLAAQGPRTLTLAEEITGLDLSRLKRYRLKEYEFFGARVLISRTGYTGEDGLEVIIPASACSLLIPRLLGVPESPHPVIKPAGLGARDTLRIEASMPLYSHEISEDTDSLTAGQGWCVDLTRDFVGAAAMRLVQQCGIPRRLVGLELDGRRIARQHQTILSKGAKDGKTKGEEEEIGEVTSGTLSPSLGKSIAMGFVCTPYDKVGTEVEVVLGRQRVAARVVKMPFYKRTT